MKKPRCVCDSGAAGVYNLRRHRETVDLALVPEWRNWQTR
jgi:hypothetical protein